MLKNALRIVRNFLRSVYVQWRRFLKTAFWTLCRALRLVGATLRRLLFGKRRSARSDQTAAPEEALEAAPEAAAEPE